MRRVLIFLLLSTVLAYPLVTNVIHIANHGGWGLYVNIGADKGDTITMEVSCNRGTNGICFDGIPKLASGKHFSLKINKPYDQTWEVVVPKTGDQFVTAQYLGVGLDWNYEIKIVAVER